MSISDRLSEIRARIVRAREGRQTDRHMVLDVDAPALVEAVRAVFDVCEGLEEAHRANPTQMYEYGMEEAAHQVRNAIAAALGRGDGIDTTPERVHETPNREHIQEARNGQ